MVGYELSNQIERFIQLMIDPMIIIDNWLSPLYNPNP